MKDIQYNIDRMANEANKELLIKLKKLDKDAYKYVMNSNTFKMVKKESATDYNEILIYKIDRVEKELRKQLIKKTVLTARKKIMGHTLKYNRNIKVLNKCLEDYGLPGHIALGVNILNVRDIEDTEI